MYSQVQNNIYHLYFYMWALVQLWILSRVEESCQPILCKDAKRPPEDAAPPAAASKLAKQAKGAPAVGSMGTSCPTAKNGPAVPAVRPMGMVLEIVGTAQGDGGRNCDEHTCCSEVLEEDVVVRLWWEQILIPNKLGKGEKEEMAYTIDWVTDGHDRCRVGFLPCAYVVEGGMFD